MRNIELWANVAPRFPKKHHLGPQNGSGSLGPEKNAKNSKLCYNYGNWKTKRDSYGGPSGIGGWPPTST